MSFPTVALDRLFARLTATYGAAWDRSLGQAPINDVKALWAHELQGFSSHLDAVAWALENLPERCPNVIEFRNLCRRAPEPERPRLEEPRANLERIREELAKLGPVRQAMTGGGRPNTDWAHRIVGRSKAGERISPTVLKMAQDVVNRGQRDPEVIDV